MIHYQFNGTDYYFEVRRRKPLNGYHNIGPTNSSRSYSILYFVEPFEVVIRIKTSYSDYTFNLPICIENNSIQWTQCWDTPPAMCPEFVKYIEKYVEKYIKNLVFS